jgi:hypothetical protein
VRLIFILALLYPLMGQTLDLSPIHGRKIDTWNVSGCAAKAIPISQVYHAATLHGLSWVLPAQYTTIMTKKSLYGRIVTWTTFASVGASVLLTSKVVTANVQVQEGVETASAFLTAALPLAQQRVPVVDPNAGKDILMGVTGCGTGLFYAIPSNVGPFSVTLN